MTYRIDIPGVGVGTAENGATESTLNLIARLLQTSITDRQRFQNAAQNAFKQVKYNSDEAAGAMGAMAAAINQSSNSISQGTTRVNRNISELFETSSQTSN